MRKMGLLELLYNIYEHIEIYLQNDDQYEIWKDLNELFIWKFDILLRLKWCTDGISKPKYARNTKWWISSFVSFHQNNIYLLFEFQNGIDAREQNEFYLNFTAWVCIFHQLFSAPWWAYNYESFISILKCRTLGSRISNVRK